MERDILLVSTSEGGGNITTWDIATCTQLTSFKGNSSPANGLALLGRDYLIATQVSKGAIHIWTWHKDQVHQRSFAAEPLSAVAVTPDGLYCAAGGASGSIHVWEVSSGRLLRSWPAHYKAVTTLAFNDSGSILVSGGEDTLVNAWLLAEVLDSSGGAGGAGAAVQLGGAASLHPLHSWSDHTLPITGLAVGAGDANGVVVSASLDRSVKVRSLGGGGLLLSAAFPAAVRSVALEPGEHALYAGCASGAIYEVSLVGDDNASEDYRSAGGSKNTSAGAAAAAAGAAGTGGRYRVMEGHSRAVTCLGFTGDGAHLVSGSEDQSVRVWDLRSRQQVRLLPSPAKGPVTGLLVIDRPPFMLVGGSHAASEHSQATSTKKGPKRLQPLAPFAKYANSPGVLRPWEGGLVLIDGSNCPSNGGIDELAGGSDAWGGGNSMLLSSAAAPAAGAGGGGSGGAAAATGVGGVNGEQQTEQDVETLREENARLKEQLGRALQAAQQWGRVNTELQQMCSDMLLQR